MAYPHSMKLNDITYVLKFHHTDGSDEFCYYDGREYAQEDFDLFDHSDSDIYTYIAFFEHDWRTNTTHMIELKAL